MSFSRHVQVKIDLGRVRSKAERIARETGVAVLAVIKADAYGLGAEKIARAIADLVGGFCVFGAEEAVAIDLWRLTGKAALAIGPPANWAAADYLQHHVRPAVATAAQAGALKAARPVLCVDTGQQRFACPLDQVEEALRAGACEEAYTHATRMEQVKRLVDAVGGRSVRMHAAGSSLLNEPAARLDAVRPGLALYRGAARVSTRLVECRKGAGPAGYSGFVAPYHGVILAGYSNGLQAGPCRVNGRPSRLLEVGMQSAFVETTADDRPGDEVVLLGDTLEEEQVAPAWRTSPHEVLVRLARSGVKEYAGG